MSPNVCFQRQSKVDTKHCQIQRGVERTSRLREISCELHGKQRQHRKTSCSCLETDFILVAAVLKFPRGFVTCKEEVSTVSTPPKHQPRPTSQTYDHEYRPEDKAG